MPNGKFYVKIIGIIFDPAKRKILIGKNNGDEHFSFIDGELRYDEELNQGVKRVTQEKTGYIVSNLGSVFAGINPEKEDELAMYFLCEVKDGQEAPGEKVEEIKWVKAHEIEELIKEKLPEKLHEYIFSIAS